ncbi:hypothetical protein VP01_9237g1, partial [Puccinia sorghi]
MFPQHPQRIRRGNTTKHSHIYLHFRDFQSRTTSYHHHHCTPTKSICQLRSKPLFPKTIRTIIQPNHNIPRAIKLEVQVNIYFSNNIRVFCKLKELCGCPKCSTHSFVEDGITRHGIYVHPRTRQKHWQEAARNAGKSLPKALVNMTIEDSPSLLNTRKQAHLRSDTTISSCSSDDHEYKPISITHRMYSSYACQFGGKDLNVDSSVLLDYVMIFVAWLYLVCGMSQARC